MRKTFSLLAALFLLLTPLGATAAQVTASFFPIYLITLNLTDGLDDIQVHSLAAPQTGCLHDYQLSTGDLRVLDQSQLFLICGAGMEAFLPVISSAFPDLPVADASQGLDLLPSMSGETEYNAHIWLDPLMASRMAENLAESLIRVLPEEEDGIRKNLKNYQDRLEKLDGEIREILKDAEGREIITFHEAFPYFARRYHLKVAAVIALEPDESLSARALADLIDLIRERGGIPLFTEPQYPSLSAEVVSAESGAPLYALDPVVTPPEGELSLTYYEDTMLNNALVLSEALSDAP